MRANQPGPEQDRLHRYISDLFGILTLATLWVGQETSEIASGLVDALFGNMDLDFIHLRLSDVGGLPLAISRMSQWMCSVVPAGGVDELLTLSTHVATFEQPRQLALDEGPLAISSRRLGRHGKLGELVVGSRRANFPSQAETVLLDVATSHAAAAMQASRSRYDQQQLIHDLSMRLDTKTRQLAESEENSRRKSSYFRSVLKGDARDPDGNAQAKRESDLAQIVNTIPGLAWSARSDGTAEFFNQHYLAYIGMSAVDAGGWGWAAAVHPDDLPGLTEQWAEMLKAGRAGEAEARLRRFDGEFRWFLFRIAFLCDEAGTVTKWFGINTDIEDRKRAEEALRSSEWSLRQMTETIPQMLWSAAPDGRITYCNHHLQDFTGFSAEAIRGGGWTNLLHPDDVEPTRKVWLRCVEAGEPYQVEVRTIHAADGTYRWLLTNALPLRDGNGKITQWYGTCVDIHDRKVAEASIAASERNLAQIIDTIPVYVWAASSDHSIDFLNKHCLEYLGISREQARDFTWSRVVHPEDYRRHVSTWDKLFASGCGSESQIRLRRFDGQYRWFLFRANPLKDADGSVRWFAVAIDIEEAKQGEDLLRASEWNLRHLTETIPQMLWSAAPDGMIDYCNTRLLDYTGFSGEEIIGDGWRSLVHPDDLEMAARAWSSSIAGGTPFQVEARVIHAAGRAHRWCLTTALPLRDERGRILKWHGACVDMHDWKKAQDELRDMQAELAHVTRVMTMGQLTASIAHELNQPLAGIMTNAGTGLRMLSTIPANVEGARETARRTIRDAKRASEVISRLRALFAKRSAVSEVVDLSAITREVIALSTPELRRNGIDLKATLAGNLPLVVGDRVQLQQVIFNFLLNGIESMAKVVDQSKEMAISTDVDEDGHVRVTVRDSGTGFDVADARKLFSPFYTTKDSGMGIGLSVSRTIIENHQGRLWAELNDGIGATFGFSIPATNSVGQPLRGPDVPLPGPADAGGHG